MVVSIFCARSACFFVRCKMCLASEFGKKKNVKVEEKKDVCRLKYTKVEKWYLVRGGGATTCDRGLDQTFEQPKSVPNQPKSVPNHAQINALDISNELWRVKYISFFKEFIITVSCRNKLYIIHIFPVLETSILIENFNLKKGTFCFHCSAFVSPVLIHPRFFGTIGYANRLISCNRPYQQNNCACIYSR